MLQSVSFWPCGISASVPRCFCVSLAPSAGDCLEVEPSSSPWSSTTLQGATTALWWKSHVCSGMRRGNSVVCVCAVPFLTVLNRH